VILRVIMTMLWSSN